MNKLNKKLFGTARKGFTLIELMIVIVIIGALTAIILPQFDTSEAEAKDAGCDASNYGTLSQLSKYRSLNGVYPSRMHTGFEKGTTNTMGTTNGVSALASITKANWTNSDTGSTETLTAEQAASLKEAGIVTLAYGGFGGEVEFKPVAQDMEVPAVTTSWYELWELNATTGKREEGNLDKGSAPVTINGVKLENYIYEDPQVAEADPTTAKKDGIVVPLFIAPTTDWEHWYDADGNENDSKIQVAQAGGCPWLEGGSEFRYYIAFFKVYDDGRKAKLLGTACPECGSLNP